MANRYWVGGTGIWTNTARWSTSSGGSGGASVPTSSDNAFFDANSFTTTGQTVTVNNSPCLNLDFTGVLNNPTLNKNGQTLTISGNLILVPGMKIINHGSFEFNSSTTCSIITAALTVGNLRFTGSGIYTLQDNVVSTGYLDVRSGTLNLNNKNTYFTYAVFSASSQACTINMGTGTMTLTTSSGLQALANFTVINCDTSTINIVYEGGFLVEFLGANNTFYNVNFTGGSGTNYLIRDNNTFNTLSVIKGDTNLRFFDGTTTTVKNFNVSGTPGKLITIKSNSTGTHSLIKVGDGIISCNYLNIQHSIATPSNTWYAGNYSVDNQGVEVAGSGWNFISPPTTGASVSTNKWGNKEIYFKQYLPTIKKKQTEVSRLKSELLRRLI